MWKTLYELAAALFEIVETLVEVVLGVVIILLICAMLYWGFEVNHAIDRAIHQGVEVLDRGLRN